jgi:hypothetical protein
MQQHESSGKSMACALQNCIAQLKQLATGFCNWKGSVADKTT